MDQLQQKVRNARSRLNLQVFLGIVTWSIFAWLIVAAIALAAPKIWTLGLGQWSQTYTWSVVIGASAAGLVTAAVWTWLRRRGDLEAALEIDHRFGLKERISSTLALSPEQLDSEAGQALLRDAVRRTERIDVGDRFGVKARWTALLPLAPALLVFALAVFVNDADRKDEAEAATGSADVKAQIKTAEEQLKRRIAQRRKEAEERGLEDAEDMFNKLQRGLDGLHKKSQGDRKKAMIELNNLAKQIKDRKQRLADSETIKQQMNNLKDLKQGPADKVADALKHGEFNRAADELRKLAEEMQQGELTRQEQEQLQNQMEQMAQKLQQLADAHEQAQDELKKQIEQAKQQGDLAKAGELQQKLDQMQQQQPAMDQMQQMANQLGQAAQNMKDGNQHGAAEELAEMQQQLDQLQQMEDEMQMVEEAMQQIAEAKNAMNCQQCGGQGCQQCQGQGLARGNNQGRPGQGIGAGPGRRFGPAVDQKSQTYDSQVRGQVRPGSGIVAGKTGGPNKAGDVREEIKQAIRSAGDGAADPLTNERLPRWQRDHVKEYYDAFRQGSE